MLIGPQYFVVLKENFVLREIPLSEPGHVVYIVYSGKTTWTIPITFHYSVFKYFPSYFFRPIDYW